MPDVRSVTETPSNIVEKDENPDSEEDTPVYGNKGFFSFLKDWSPGSLRGRRSQRQDPVAVGAPIPPNPKLFFANERTFLHWMNLCVILGGLSMALLNFGDRVAQTAAAAFGLISVILMFYSLAQFWIRAERLTKKERGNVFEDPVGILAMVAVVFLAVGINLGLQFTTGTSMIHSLFAASNH
ncbi:uncharacterized protein EV422DRAFT_505660 [Fimicolochytrium jonesii]|uniref:uncharacterized protein n=1 Tax=Fimicolochytrium jonesii TaxID=1396493 RepID=UPI0022FEA3C0|nr:uncharacterized protein EV422DRAFT_505660 [Fimicolochytrium jonesii]KAI8822165.1 hypothetical protein EV422DRAFT_505660 [Fimicolochytrium jonesii]